MSFRSNDSWKYPARERDGRRLAFLLLSLCTFAPLRLVGGDADETYQHTGVVQNLPVFHRELKERIVHPWSWMSGRHADFAAWRAAARERVEASLMVPPPDAPWNVKVIGEEDRGDYICRKLIFNLTGDSRVLAYMTVPKGKGPFPAVLLLHSHDGEYRIGKEKMIRPWGVPTEKTKHASDFVAKAYGGRFIGDELARRGYVCFATDALNWSDRGGGEYDGQSAIAANLMHLGMSFAGLIAWEDVRSATFLSQQPEVDSRRVAAMGLSIGALRTWQVAALSDEIKAGVSICWMSTVKDQMSPGMNQTRGESSFTSLHPGLLADLDYPDIASLACPKPMLFYHGTQDRLFGRAGVEEAYTKMRAVWSSQGASDNLETRTWDVRHEFNREMQEASFSWLDRVLGNPVDR